MKKDDPRTVHGPRALEMIMKDVLDGMEELAAISLFDHPRVDTGLLSVEATPAPPDPEPAGAGRQAEVLDLTTFRRTRRVARSA